MGIGQNLTNRPSMFLFLTWETLKVARSVLDSTFRGGHVRNMDVQ